MKVTIDKLTDDYMLANGYWKITQDTQSAHLYDIIVPSEKWRMLFDTCIRKTPKDQIITVDLIVEVINEGDTERHKIRNYRKLSQEEKDRRTAERHRLKDLKSNERRSTK